MSQSVAADPPNRKANVVSHPNAPMGLRRLPDNLSDPTSCFCLKPQTKKIDFSDSLLPLELCAIYRRNCRAVVHFLKDTKCRFSPSTRFSLSVTEDELRKEMCDLIQEFGSDETLLHSVSVAPVLHNVGRCCMSQFASDVTHAIQLRSQAEEMQSLQQLKVVEKGVKCTESWCLQKLELLNAAIAFLEKKQTLTLDRFFSSLQALTERHHTAQKRHEDMQQENKKLKEELKAMELKVNSLDAENTKLREQLCSSTLGSTELPLEREKALQELKSALEALHACTKQHLAQNACQSVDAQFRQAMVDAFSRGSLHIEKAEQLLETLKEKQSRQQEISENNTLMPICQKKRYEQLLSNVDKLLESRANPHSTDKNTMKSLEAPTVPTMSEADRMHHALETLSDTISVYRQHLSNINTVLQNDSLEYQKLFNKTLSVLGRCERILLRCAKG